MGIHAPHIHISQPSPISEDMNRATAILSRLYIDDRAEGNTHDSFTRNCPNAVSEPVVSALKAEFNGLEQCLRRGYTPAVSRELTQLSVPWPLIVQASDVERYDQTIRSNFDRQGPFNPTDTSNPIAKQIRGKVMEKRLQAKASRPHSVSAEVAVLRRELGLPDSVIGDERIRRLRDTATEELRKMERQGSLFSGGMSGPGFNNPFAGTSQQEILHQPAETKQQGPRRLAKSWDLSKTRRRGRRNVPLSTQPSSVNSLPPILE